MPRKNFPTTSEQMSNYIFAKSIMHVNITQHVRAASLITLTRYWQRNTVRDARCSTPVKSMRTFKAENLPSLCNIWEEQLSFHFGSKWEHNFLTFYRICTQYPIFWKRIETMFSWRNRCAIKHLDCFSMLQTYKLRLDFQCERDSYYFHDFLVHILQAFVCCAFVARRTLNFWTFNSEIGSLYYSRVLAVFGTSFVKAKQI